MFVAHDRRARIIDVEFACRARTLDAGALPVEGHDSNAGHHIDPAHIFSAVRWLAAAAAENRPATTTSALGR